MLLTQAEKNEIKRIAELVVQRYFETGRFPQRAIFQSPDQARGLSNVEVVTITAADSPYTVPDNVAVILADTFTGDITILTPAASLKRRTTYLKIHPTNTMGLTPPAGETYDGLPGLNITDYYGYLIIQGAGFPYSVIEGYGTELLSPPSPHASTHEEGGSDEIDVTGLDGVIENAFLFGG